MQSGPKSLSGSCFILFVALFLANSAHPTIPDSTAGLGHTLIRPNPFGKRPSTPIPSIPGFTERDILVILVAQGCNNCIFSVQDYSKAITYKDCEQLWEQLKGKSEDFAISTLHDRYRELFHGKEAREDAYNRNSFLNDLSDDIKTILKDESHCKDFYNYERMLELKLKILETFIKSQQIAIRAGNVAHALQPTIEKLGKQIINFETKLLELNLLNDTAPWDKAKKASRAIFRPLTGAYKRFNPLRPNNTKERSNVFYDFLSKKYLTLETKIQHVATRLNNPNTPEWSNPTAFADDFNVDGTLKFFPSTPYQIPETSKAANHEKLSLHPFGTVSSAPSPIPGVSWRRLAELCRTDKQSWHALDFSLVVDWRSFLYFMKLDAQAHKNPSGLFAQFLKLYAPKTYNSIFNPSMDRLKALSTEPLNSSERPQKYLYFINALIEKLNNPHKAHVEYKKRSAITKLEARLLTKLVDLYKTTAGLYDFPEVSYKLHNIGKPKGTEVPLATRFDPFNVEIYLNTENLTLKKLIKRLRTLDSTEIKANRTNRHAVWNRALQTSKAISGIIASPLSLPGKAIFSRTRTSRFSAKFKDNQRRLRGKIETALSGLKLTKITRGYLSHISLAPNAATPSIKTDHEN